jgi:uncharacterized protein
MLLLVSYYSPQSNISSLISYPIYPAEKSREYFPLLFDATLILNWTNLPERAFMTNENRLLKGISMKRIYIILILVTLGSGLFALKPQKEYLNHPNNFALIYKDISCQAADSSKVAAWFFPPQQLPLGETIIAARNEGILPDYTAPTEPSPTIVIANGDAGNMSNQINFVVAFCPLGYNVVLFDWRGFGESGDWLAESNQLCYKEYLWDYAAVIDRVYRQPEVDHDKVALYGGSTGAYLSIAAAFSDTRVDIVILRALLTSFDDVLPGLRAAKPERDLQAPDGYPENLLPVNIAPKMKIPVFLIVGEKDEVTPVEMSQKIYDLLPDKKELWIVPDAEHGGEKGPVYSNFELFTTKVNEFMKSNW